MPARVDRGGTMALTDAIVPDFPLVNRSFNLCPTPATTCEANVVSPCRWILTVLRASEPGWVGPSPSLKSETRRSVMDVPDKLEMLVTSDPVAELDEALARGVARLRAARALGDAEAVRRLNAWIDHWLDQRIGFRHEPPTDSDVPS